MCQDNMPFKGRPVNTDSNNTTEHILIRISQDVPDEHGQLSQHPDWPRAEDRSSTAGRDKGLSLRRHVQIDHISSASYLSCTEGSLTNIYDYHTLRGKLINRPKTLLQNKNWVFGPTIYRTAADV